jgi:type II secretory pathway pseudopilin PulG
MRTGNRAGLQGGFGYLMVLFALAAIGFMLAGAGQVWHTTSKREKEVELLAIGNQFRQALASYYRSSPGPQKQLPKTLEDLIEDKRFSPARHHLRALYVDPMTGEPRWGLVIRAGQIAGVYSLSDTKALKTFFEDRDAGLNGTSRHDQWIFGPDSAP